MIKRKRVFSVKEAAEVLGLSPIRVRQLCQSGRIGEKAGFSWVIGKDELNEFKKLDRGPGKKLSKR